MGWSRRGEAANCTLEDNRPREHQVVPSFLGKAPHLIDPPQELVRPTAVDISPLQLGCVGSRCGNSPGEITSPPRTTTTMAKYWECL